MDRTMLIFLETEQDTSRIQDDKHTQQDQPENKKHFFGNISKNLYYFVKISSDR